MKIIKLKLKEKYKYINEEVITDLEKKIDKYQSITPKINYFVLPGGSLISSFIGYEYVFSSLRV